MVLKCCIKKYVEKGVQKQNKAYIFLIIMCESNVVPQSGYMKDKQMAARPVLRMSASVDLRAASLHDAKKLLERLQELMRDPMLLDRSLASSFFDSFYYYYGAIETCQLLH